jgi:hypothetical protein
LHGKAELAFLPPVAVVALLPKHVDRLHDEQETEDGMALLLVGLAASSLSPSLVRASCAAFVVSFALFAVRLLPHGLEKLHGRLRAWPLELRMLVSVAGSSSDLLEQMDEKLVVAPEKWTAEEDEP